MKEKLIQRYTRPERTNHWVAAICFVLLVVSGLAFFYPAFFWLTDTFGTSQLARMIHPTIGVVMFLGFARQFLRYWYHNLIDKEDVKWVTSVSKVLKGYEVGDVGKYNGGQKDMFWLMTACMSVLTAIGAIAWCSYFAQYFPIPAIRLALLARTWAATILIAGIIVHAYTAIRINDTIRVMVEGVVTQAWVKKHHSRWYREMTAKNKAHEENTGNGGIDGEAEKS